MSNASFKRDHAVMEDFTDFAVSADSISSLDDLATAERTARLKPKLEELASQVPRYLFRAHSLESQGYNSPTLMKSSLRHVIKRVGRPLDTIPHARHMIVEHLGWQNKPSDDFISWTSSLLFAIQRANWTKGKEDRDDLRQNQAQNVGQSKEHVRTSSKLDMEIYITIIDTQNLPKGRDVSFYRASSLLDIFEIEAGDKLKRKLFTHEYLCLGEVHLSKTSASTMSFREMIQRGLFGVYPELACPVNERVWLFKAVMSVRFGPQFNHDWYLALVDSPRLLNIAEAIAGENLYLPFAIALLALRKRRMNDPNIGSHMWQVISAQVGRNCFSKTRRAPQDSYDFEVDEFWNIMGEVLKLVKIDTPASKTPASKRIISGPQIGYLATPPTTPDNSQIVDDNVLRLVDEEILEMWCD